VESLELTAPVAAFDGAIYIRPDSPTVVRDLHAVLGTALKIVAVSADPSLTARCEQELQRRLGSEAWAARSNASYVDVTHADANKGMVVRDVSRIFNLPLDEIATIGDMPNDIPMLALAASASPWATPAKKCGASPDTSPHRTTTRASRTRWSTSSSRTGKERRGDAAGIALAPRRCAGPNN
jgi:hypothetical protein